VQPIHRGRASAAAAAGAAAAAPVAAAPEAGPAAAAIQERKNSFRPASGSFALLLLLQGKKIANASPQ
jgi:hypothetical protein